MNKKILSLHWQLLAAGGLILSSHAVLADISGKVFHDFNANGVLDSTESGVAGVTVTATDAAGAAATATTGADGSYAFPNSGVTAVGNKVRVEFSNLPEFANSGTASTGTDVQFITVAAATTANFAITYADNYCQANPKMATPLYRSGAGNNQVLMFSYLNEGTSPLDKTTIANASIGSLWGMAYSRSQKLLYASAVLKSHIPLAAEGLDAIYTIDPAKGTPNATPWLQLTDDLGIAVSAVSANPQYQDNAARGVDAPPQNDATAFKDVMKVGLGDIELSADEKTLYVMNVYDKKVYAIDVATKTLKGSYAVPDAGCSNGQSRPWALGEHEGKIYAGVTCDGSASGDPASLADESGAANLKASVYRLDGAVFTQVLTFPLNYPKEPAFQYDDKCKVIAKWKPWTDTLPDTCTDGNISYPSPVLSDIEFEDNGNMILGFTDRTGFQIGHKNYGPTGTTLYSMYAAGDILKACKTGAGWGIEGTVPGCTSAGGLAINQADADGYPMSWGAQLAKAGEFYEGDYFHGDGNTDGTGLSYFPGHPEITIGGLAVVPHTGEVMSVTYDPVTGAPNYGTGGVITLNNQSGKRARNGFELYRTTDADPTTASKGVGLGDLEMLCDPAPIEIGNRLWKDTDGDGIQGADEPGIDGVDVVLTCGADTATVKTANGGQFLFSNATNATFMSAGKSCKVTVAGAGQAPLDSLSVTTPNADGVTDNNTATDLRDSDAVDKAGTAEIAFTVGNAGENNHTLDIGYKSTPVANTDLGDAPDSYKTTLAAGGARHTIVAGLHLGAVVDAEADGQPNAAADGDGTDEDGIQFLTKLVPGENAIIGVGTTQPKNSDAKLDAWIDFNGDGDFEDSGEQVAVSQAIKASSLIDQGSLPLDVTVPADAKAGTTYARFRLSTAGGLSPGGDAADGEVEDYKVEIVQGATLGDYVWQDTNKDGVQSSGEPAVAGVLVNLIRVSDGAVVKSAFTDAKGAYLFTHLLPDTYQVEFVAPTGYRFTTALQGSDATTDSNADATTGRTANITLVEGDNQRQWDAGLVMADNTIVHCDAVPFKPTELSETLSLPKFDGTLGTLTGVSVSSYSATRQLIASENSAAQTQKVKVVSTVDGYLTLPNATTVDTLTSYNSGYKNLSAADGILDYYGTSAFTLADWLYASNSKTVAYTTPADFIAATAGEMIKLPYETMSGLSTTGGGGNVQVVQRTTGSVAACVAYTYEKKAAVVDLKLTKVADKTTVKRGETVVYTLTVTNESTTTDATGVKLTDTLPAGVTYSSDDGAGNYDKTSGVWVVGSLLKGESKVLKLTVTVN